MCAPVPPLTSSCRCSAVSPGVRFPADCQLSTSQLNPGPEAFPAAPSPTEQWLPPGAQPFRSSAGCLPLSWQLTQRWWILTSPNGSPGLFRGWHLDLKLLLQSSSYVVTCSNINGEEVDWISLCYFTLKRSTVAHMIRLLNWKLASLRSSAAACQSEFPSFTPASWWGHEKTCKVFMEALLNALLKLRYLVSSTFLWASKIVILNFWYSLFRIYGLEQM